MSSSLENGVGFASQFEYQVRTFIARYTELKKNPLALEVEVEGEVVNANRIEEALRSANVALRDQKGEFRDLDDVFLELSSKWDGLNRNTQRYIATVSAGSRQQSRFIAMMNNYERTLELTEVAADSSGASIIQFADTLDSVQAKLNKIQSNFERLMGFIVENTFVKTILDITNMFLDFAGDIAKKGWIPFAIFTTLLWQNFKLLVDQLIRLASNAFNKISMEAKKIPPIIVKFIADTTQLDMVRMRLGMPPVGVPEKSPNPVAPTGKSPYPTVPTGKSPYPTAATGITPKAEGLITSRQLTSNPLANITPGLVSAFSSAFISGLITAFTTGDLKLAFGIFLMGGITSVLKDPELFASIKQLFLGSAMKTTIMGFFGGLKTTIMGFATSAAGATIGAVAGVIGLAVAPILLGKLAKHGFEQRGTVLQEDISEKQSKATESQAGFLGEKQKLKDMRALFNAYRELQQNTSRTATEEEKLLEIRGKISESFPDFISGYDSEGRALISVNADIDAQIKKQSDSALEKQKIYADDILSLAKSELALAEYEKQLKFTTLSVKDSAESQREQMAGVNAEVERAESNITKAINQISGGILSIYGESKGQKYSELGFEIGSSILTGLGEAFSKENPEATNEELYDYLESQAAEVMSKVDWSEVESQNYNNLMSQAGSLDEETFIKKASSLTTDQDIRDALLKKYNDMYNDINSFIDEHKIPIDSWLDYYDRDDLINFVGKYGKEMAAQLLTQAQTAGLEDDALKVIFNGDLTSVSGLGDMYNELINLGVSAEDAEIILDGLAKTVNKTDKITVKTAKDFSNFSKSLRTTGLYESFAKIAESIKAGGIYNPSEADMSRFLEEAPEVIGILNELSAEFISSEEAGTRMLKALQNADYNKIADELQPVVDAFDEGSEITLEMESALVRLGVSKKLFMDDMQSDSSVIKAFLSGNVETINSMITSTLTLGDISFDKLTSGIFTFNDALLKSSAQAVILKALLENMGGIFKKYEVLRPTSMNEYGDYTGEEVVSTRWSMDLSFLNGNLFERILSGTDGKTTMSESDLMANRYYAIEQQMDRSAESIEDYEDTLKKLSETEKETGIYDGVKYKATVSSLEQSLKDRQKILEEYSTMITDDLASLKTKIQTSLSEYLFFDDAGMLNYTSRGLSQSIYDDAIADKLKEAVSQYDNLLDRQQNYKKESKEINNQYDEIVKNIKTRREEIQQGYLDMEKRIVDALIYRDEEEIRLMEEKYEQMKTMDDRYLTQLQKNIQKRRAARDKEQSYDDIKKLEKRLALLRRDTSNVHAMEILEIEKTLKEDRLAMADQEVDDELELLEEAKTNRHQKYDDEMKESKNLLEDKKRNMDEYYAEATALMAKGEAAVIGFLQSFEVAFGTASDEGQKLWLEKLRITLETARSYYKEMMNIAGLDHGTTDWTTTQVDAHASAESARELLATYADKDTAAGRYIKASDDISSHDYEGALKWYNEYVDKRNDIPEQVKQWLWQIVEAKKRWHGYANGGLVDYTGIAAVHGSSTRPEAFLSATDTANIRWFADVLNSFTKTKGMDIMAGATGAGDITIYVTVDEIANDYDVEQAVNEIKRQIVNSSRSRTANIINKKR